MDAGLLNKRITIEKATVTRDANTGAQIKSWGTLGNAAWAQVIESATGSDEQLKGPMATYAKPTRIRMRYRSDIDNTMRVNLGSSRLLEIIGVAMMGRKDGLELACKEWSHE